MKKKIIKEKFFQNKVLQEKECLDSETLESSKKDVNLGQITENINQNTYKKSIDFFQRKYRTA